ncbi:hypothetical protein HHI36_003271 [Cryptolaemus montrouzieri]|uniref:Uncharacterized protein n=1 Tax=Cryptolaemus montrouzieri TaxID=559131 RepID=A0ABD2PCX1_9CUCU
MSHLSGRILRIQPTNSEEERVKKQLRMKLLGLEGEFGDRVDPQEDDPIQGIPASQSTPLRRSFSSSSNQSIQKQLGARKVEYEREIADRLQPVEALKQINVNQINDPIKSTIRTATKKFCPEVRKQKESKLSDDTIDMMQRRRTMEKGTGEHTALNKCIKKAIRKDMRTYKTK